MSDRNPTYLKIICGIAYMLLTQLFRPSHALNCACSDLCCDAAFVHPRNHTYSNFTAVEVDDEFKPYEWN
jgi:hypothetical protein